MKIDAKIESNKKYIYHQFIQSKHIVSGRKKMNILAEFYSAFHLQRKKFFFSIVIESETAKFLIS